jgi:amino acid adenylation domain-containing protein
MERRDIDFPNACVHELFEQQVARTPNAVAVVFEDRRLTYSQINQRSNQLARRLRQLGLGPETLAGVSLERSPEMVIALLAVWKAGGAYTPLDPTYPIERLSFMSADAGVQILLTDSAHRQLFPSRTAKVVFVDTDWPVIAHEDGSNLAPAATPSNLAYVMYTSGSTGQPKGAMIQHDGLVNYLWWAIEAYDITASGSVPVHTSISFDLTVTSLYAPLLAGGQVELVPEDVGAQSLLQALRKARQRDLIKLTPAHLELLSQQLRPEEAAGLTKTFVIGGEMLLAESLRFWKESAPEIRLINEYGPTEAVVGCCVYEVQPDDSTGPVPIGRPIANTQLYVLDSDLKPAAPGVAGELYIGGIGVARGYLNRPELTAERFLPDPFSPERGGRLYKTGDRCRYREDGALEFLGRIDDQVKLRGYRIELGEIESALAASSDVQSCAVAARGDSPSTMQLVGYVVPRRNQSPTPESLQRFLKQTLPEFMVPAQFVMLQALPLTPNGKLDRKALAAATPEPSSNGAGFIGPRTRTESEIAAIWSELLGLERVGIHDDFFELGGHSLMAVRAVSKMREVFGVDLPLATLLQTSTIAGLAEILGDQQWTPSWSSLVPIRPDGSRPPLFLMHAHGGNVLEYRALASRLDPAQPVYAFQARGLDGQIVKDASLEDMAAAYVEELRSFQPEGPYYLGGFCLGGLLALEAAQQLTASGKSVGLVVMIQSMHPDAGRYRPAATLLHRWWGRAAKRLDLELENLSHTGPSYVKERRRRIWDLARTRAVIALDNMRGNIPDDPSRRTTLYVSEVLGLEHQRAMKMYRPRPYGGDVLLFRASKQLPGLQADEYLGWRPTLYGALEVCETPGHQQNLLLEPNVSHLARELSQRLKAAQDGCNEQRVLSA